MADDVITINFDYSQFSASMKRIADKLKDKNFLLRPVAIELIPIMTRRIHINGLAADGTSIGTYAKSYMRTRVKYKRTEPQNKVVVSLTTKLENDWAVVPTEDGYGIGFLTQLSADKARWVEDHFGKKIFSLSDDEQKFANERFIELINDAFNS